IRINEYKQISRDGFSLSSNTQFSPHGGSSSDSTVTCQDYKSSGFQMDMESFNYVRGYYFTPKITRFFKSVVKKSGSEAPTTKGPGMHTMPVPAFKVRKENDGDRITCTTDNWFSPFGKTDKLQCFSEAIDYLKFLHEQVSVLSTPYMKGGAPIQQRNSSRYKDSDGQKTKIVRSRGLCLVPVSSLVFHVTHETTVDFGRRYIWRNIDR
ncbi:LOW QUALITY PROTEIN: transcription factor bHLH112, partial [Jatropha curcas]|uniref:LOW QUALITY PROTEIN: transcription factor bHLH112 n=1 Tax=Jatropha curcas TaxID=180498 RepID=UPI0018958DDB